LANKSDVGDTKKDP